MFSQEAMFHLIHNALLFSLFCLVHSLLARERTKKLFDVVIDRRYYRFIYVLFSVVTLVPVIVYWRPIAEMLWQTGGVLYWVMAASSSAALSGGIYCIYVMNPLDFVGIPSLLQGRESASAQSLTLSTQGPYAYCRHPMYLFFGLAGLLKPTMSYGDFEFLIIAVLYVAIAIPFEERNLRNELGESYDLYRRNVPVIIPNWRPWKYDTQDSLHREGPG